MSSRFIDDKGRVDFFDEFLVECPKCGGKASTSFRYGIRCSSCSFAKRIEERRLYSSSYGIASKRCSFCGRNISKHIEKFRENPMTDIVCHGCKTKNSAEIKWFTGGAQGTDSIFGCKLLLSLEVKGELFWALNEKHLDYLEDYVRSDLRERIPNQNGSLPSRIPKWVKNAKNRDNILKCIQQLRSNCLR